MNDYDINNVSWMIEDGKHRMLFTSKIKKEKKSFVRLHNEVEGVRCTATITAIRAGMLKSTPSTTNRIELAKSTN